MGKTRVCSYCGVPRQFSKGMRWESDGTIRPVKNPDQRSIFCEARGFDMLFRNIEELLRVHIDHIITEGKRKGAEIYLRKELSGIKGNIARTFFRRKIYEMIADIGAMFGYGHFEILDFKRGEYARVYGRNIYCLHLFCGDLTAAFNVVEGLPAEIDIKELDNGNIITVTPGKKIEDELVSRLQINVLPRKPGNIRFERCPECHLPLDFKEYTWDLEEGTITDNMAGRRMALLGPEEIESVFQELEAELGEDIPRAIVEAQCKHVVDTFKEQETTHESDHIAHQLALRGMGNLVKCDFKENTMEVVVENARPPLLVAGMIQGIFELLAGRESNNEYQRGDDGTLSVSVEAR